MEGSKYGLTVSKLEEQKYGNRISVKVVEVGQSATGTVVVALADPSGWIRGSVVGKHEGRFVEGKSVMLKGFSVRGGILRIGETTNIYSTSAVPVSDDVEEMARARYLEPVFPYIAVAELQKAAVKSKVSVRGIVTNVKSQRSVKVNGENAIVREIGISDDSGEGVVSLWRSSAEVEVEAGSTVILKDVTVTYSKFHKKLVLSVNFPSEIEIQSNEIPQTMELIAIQSQVILPLMRVLVSVNGIDKDVDMAWQFLVETLELSPEVTLDEVIELLPVEVVGIIRNGVFSSD